MIQKVYTCVLSCLLLLGVVACSPSDQEQEEQTDNAARNTGRKIAEEIQKPIDKANLAKELTEQHNQKIDENVKDE